ncbi:uncharacterized protein EV422DRAFT_536696 [Fimicolochytrium jonesii]|uniref:uncharacterized protein n=1 Tax=Fimicolochytrium jonesii TaxID=1396493 RepID=UPI0022FE9BE5|nr:uncharacterized protein EV422DRAFT_536696 [Fimicolochytrium jonesii]KAI8818756.1 hypothetical protein EV422DRAFT_536696 [Fimicolochytrium jonesii]
MSPSYRWHFRCLYKGGPPVPKNRKLTTNSHAATRRSERNLAVSQKLLCNMLLYLCARNIAPRCQRRYHSVHAVPAETENAIAPTTATADDVASSSAALPVEGVASSSAPPEVTAENVASSSAPSEVAAEDAASSSAPSEVIDAIGPLQQDPIKAFRQTLVSAQDLLTCWGAFRKITKLPDLQTQLSQQDLRLFLLRFHEQSLKVLAKAPDSISRKLPDLCRVIATWSHLDPADLVDEYNLAIEIYLNHHQTSDAQRVFGVLEVGGKPNLQTCTLMVRMALYKTDVEAAETWIARINEAEGRVPTEIYVQLLKLHVATDEQKIDPTIAALKSKNISIGWKQLKELGQYALTRRRLKGLVALLPHMMEIEPRATLAILDRAVKLCRLYPDLAGAQTLLDSMQRCGDYGVTPQLQCLTAKLYAAIGEPEQLISFLDQMIDCGNSLTLAEVSAILNMFVRRKLIGYVEPFKTRVMAMGIFFDFPSYTLLLRANASCDMVKEVEDTLDMLSESVQFEQCIHALRMYSKLDDSKSWQRCYNRLGRFGNLIDATTAQDWMKLHQTRGGQFEDWLVTLVDGRALKVTDPSVPQTRENLRRLLAAALKNNDIGQAEFAIRELTRRHVNAAPVTLPAIGALAIRERNRYLLDYCIAQAIHINLGPTDVFRLVSDDVEVSMESTAMLRGFISSLLDRQELRDAVSTYRSTLGPEEDFSTKFKDLLIDVLIEKNLRAATAYLKGRGAKAIGTPEAFIKALTSLSLRCRREDEKALRDFLSQLKDLNVLAPTDVMNRFLKSLVANSKAKEAAKLVKEMRKATDPVVKPDIVTYQVLMRSLAEAKEVELFRGYWSCLRQDGIYPDHALYTSRIALRIRQGEVNSLERAIRDLHDAQNELGPFPKQTYGMLIKALLDAGNLDRARMILDKMTRANVLPNEFIYGLFLSYHLKHEQYSAMFSLEQEQRAAGLPFNTVLYTILITAAARQKDVARAHFLYREMKAAGIEPDVQVMTAVMAAFAANKNIEGMMDVYEDMRKIGVKPTLTTWNTMLSAYARISDVKSVDRLLDEMKTAGVEADQTTWEALWKGNATSGNIKEMHRYLSKLVGSEPGYPRLQRDARFPTLVLPLYNRVLDAHAAKGDVAGVETWFALLRSADLKPDIYSYSPLFEVYARAGDFAKVEEVKQKASMEDIRLDANAVSRVVNALLAAGHLDFANRFLDSAAKDGVTLDPAVFNPFIAYWQRVDHKNVLSVVEQMRAKGVEPNVATYTQLINALAHSNRHEEGWDIWRSMVGQKEQIFHKGWGVWATALGEQPISAHVAALQIRRTPMDDLALHSGSLLSILLDLCGFAGWVDRADVLWSRVSMSSRKLEENHLASYVECLLRNGQHARAIELVTRETGVPPAMPTPGHKTYGTLLGMLQSQGLIGEREALLSHLRAKHGEWLLRRIDLKYPGVVGKM